MFNFTDTLHNSYRVGSVIDYRPFGGSVRRIVVTNREDDVKNGRPGFDGTILEHPDDKPFDVWGYDDQILRIVQK